MEVLLQCNGYASDTSPAKGALTLIAEIDGSMVPIVQPVTSDGDGLQDRRKTRKVFWQEAKLSMIRRAHEVKPIFAVTPDDAEVISALAPAFEPDTLPSATPSRWGSG